MSLITIQQFTLPCENLADGNSYVLRCWYNQGFLDSSGQAVAPGTPTSGTQLRSDATVSGGFITFDPFTVYSTLDAEVPNPQSIQIACQLFKGNTALPIYPFNQNGTSSFWIVPDDLGGTISFEEWTIANQRIVLANPPLTFYTAAQVDALIEAGIIQAALNQDYVIADYATFALAVAAATITSGTLVINQSTSTGTQVVPTNVTLRFTRKGSLTVTTGQTVTVLGPVEADPVKIFYNALSGQGTVSFVGNVSIPEYHPEWWGYLVNGLTASASANQSALNACIASLPNNQPGYNGGIVRLMPGLQYITGLTITDQQVHITGSGSGGDTGSTITASTILASTSNSPIIKYAFSTNVFSFNSRLEHLVIKGNNTGSSQHGIWVDNNGIRLTDVTVQGTGGQGLYLTWSTAARYWGFEAHNCTGDGIRFASSQSANVAAGTNENVFVGTVIGDCARGVHFLSGHGNQFYMLNTEHNLNQGVYFDNDAGAPSAVTYNNIYGLWSEGDIGPGFETQGTDQNNYVQLVRIPDVAPVINSSSVGDLYDTVETYGTAATRRLGRLIVGSNAAMIAGADGIQISTGDLSLSGNSGQRIKWGTTFPQIGISSTTNVLFLDAAGTGDGSINLGPSTSGFVQFKRNGAGVDIRNGDDSLYGVLTAKSLMVDSTGKFETKPKTNDTWGAAISLDVGISNHDITAVFGTSATAIITPTAAGTAGDWIFINTINGVGGSVVVTFASTFHSSGTQTTSASKYSSIAFRSTGSVWVEQYRTTDLA